MMDHERLQEAERLLQSALDCVQRLQATASHPSDVETYSLKTKLADQGDHAARQAAYELESLKRSYFGRRDRLAQILGVTVGGSR